MLERFFRLAENQTSARTEVLAGVTTFLTMAYIIFVQPAVLSGAMFGHRTGMDFGAVTAASCLSAALATAIMALYARYPIAQAPGMGENFFFVFSAIPAAAAAGSRGLAGISTKSPLLRPSGHGPLRAKESRSRCRASCPGHAFSLGKQTPPTW